MSILIDEDLQISFDQYLADCEQYYNSKPVELWGSWFEHVESFIEDYKLWVTDREKWMEKTI